MYTPPMSKHTIEQAFSLFMSVTNKLPKRAVMAALLGPLFFLSTGMGASPGGKGDKSYIVYIGTYTRIASKGIYGYRFSPKTGEITPLGLIQEAHNPSWITESPNHRFLYATD